MNPEVAMALRRMVCLAVLAAARDGDAAALSAYSRRCQRTFITETRSLIDHDANGMAASKVVEVK